VVGVDVEDGLVKVKVKVSIGGHSGLADENSRKLLGQEEVLSCQQFDVGEAEGGVPDGHLVVYIASPEGEEIILGPAKVYRSYR
jgi:hypothetical protein